jgi:Flp pilus assembly pilin Flp
MAQRVYGFLRDDGGQDLIEYSLLIMFIAIACMALVGSGRPAVNTVWQAANSQIANAVNVAGS